MRCRLASAAIYCGRACLTLVESAEELQAAILTAGFKTNVKLLIQLEPLLEEACCFFLEFSSRRVPDHPRIWQTCEGCAAVCSCIMFKGLNSDLH